jgi:hypothetical protein
MEELTGQFAVRVGVDLAKNVIQVHAENSRGKVLAAKALSECDHQIRCPEDQS